MPPTESSIAILLLWAVIGYGLGSIPFGIVMARLFGLGDLRAVGSGNIGATNVLRTGNKPAAALTLLLDAGKGVIAVLLTLALAGKDAAQLAGFTALFGHCYPVWMGFRGGKGIATFFGLWAALALPVCIACCVTWLTAAALTRMSSVGGLAAAASSVVWTLLLGHSAAMSLALALAAVVFWRHKPNIIRILAGTEPRIGQKTPA